MAYIDNFGLLRGRCGDKVYLVRNNQQIVRSLPKKRVGTSSKAQLQQQMKFAATAELVTIFKPVLSSFESAYRKKTRNKLFSHVLTDVVTIEDKTPVFDYSKLILLYGRLPSCRELRFRCDFLNAITIEWDNDLCHKYKVDQLMGLIVYCPQLKTFKNYRYADRKGKDFAVFCLDEVFQNKEIHCWVYSYCAKKESDAPLKETQFSTTTYLGKRS